MLWLGKFAFPKVNTKTTKVYMVPPHTYMYNFPVMDVEPIKWTPDPLPTASFQIDRVELNKWAYKGKLRTAIIRFAYYERLDILVVVNRSFEYLSKSRISLEEEILSDLDKLHYHIERWVDRVYGR